LLLAAYGCTDSPPHEADAARIEPGPSDGSLDAASDSRLRDAAADSDARDAASSPTSNGDSGAFLAQATAQLSLIRPRTTVGPEFPANDVDATTAWWPIAGTATFRTTPEGVDLIVHATQCRTAYSYPVFLYAETDCSLVTRDSKPWGDGRGTLKSKALCFGAPGASVYESRSQQEPASWTIGGAAASNVLGRTIAIHDPDTMEPLACGTVQVTDGGVPWVPLRPEQRPSNVVALQLAGVCGLGRPLSRADAGPSCPDPESSSKCLLTHCLAPCIDVCAQHIACLEASSEVCTADCELMGPCANCLQQAAPCMLNFCRHEFACSPPPTPGGPCTQLRECCMRQGPVVEGCMGYAQILEDLSGDPSCLGGLWDRDVNTNFTYRSPCYPDGGAPMD
jgi:hypothetical protein